MHRCVCAVLCFVGVLAIAAYAQKASVEPVTIPAGTVLTFHLQTRLNPANANELDVLPKGTVLRVKILHVVDSSVNRDGSEFRGELVSPLTSGKDIVVRPGSEVRGLLVLLRSRTHPEGFRYELLITQITDKGRSFDLTASWHSSLADIDNNRQPSAEPEPLKSHETTAPPAGKLPASH